MRFSNPEGNPTSVFDRAEGCTYKMINVEEAKKLYDLLNTMHEELGNCYRIIEDSGLDFSAGKIHTGGDE